MAIKKSFGGASIRKPGSYSISKQDNSAGSPLGTLDTIFLIGEADSGKPGSVEGITEFSAEQFSLLVAKYGSGPLVDCALAAKSPSKTQGIGGAGRFLVWKTNASTDASLTVKEATNTSPLLVISDLAWGVSGNELSVTISNGDTAKQKQVVINRLNDVAEVLGENPALAILSIHYTGNATTAAAVISGSSMANKTLATTLAGDQTDGSANLSIVLANYSMKQLVDFINAQPGYAAVLLANPKAANRANELDSIASVSILTTQSLYRLQQEMLELINSSARVSAVLSPTPVIGLPVNVTNSLLTGGAKGASVNSDFSTGLAKSLAQTYSDALPCISRDATADIADSLTDASSTYTIASVQAALDSHLRLRSQVKNRKEAQGWTGFRNTSKAACYAAAEVISSELVQFAIQDVLVLDVNSNLTWKQPHVFAALCAGIRLGTDIGEPLTHKLLNCNGVGHVVNPLTGLEAGDFNTDLDGDDAIDAGVIYSEKIPAGNRIVVDNTTYGADQSFVFNRGSVMEAAQYSAITLRQTADDVFVGKKLQNGKLSGGKISGGAAQSLKSVLRNKLIDLWNANIITTSIDAPNGFREDTFTVQIQGNTATVEVEIKPVQGLDFIFITFTLGDIKQSA